MRREAEREAAKAQSKISEAIGREGSRHTAAFTAGIRAQAQIDVSALLRDDDLVDLISIRSEEANRLITNLAQDIHDRIERETLGAIFEGRSNADIAKSLQDIDGIGRRRATLIARDQASKLNAAMNEFRQRQVGVTHYKWRTILDGRERPSHHANNGKVFSWDRPPANTGHPGHDINCRCRALAILTDDPEEISAETLDPPNIELHGRSFDLPSDGLKNINMSVAEKRAREIASDPRTKEALMYYAGPGYKELNGALRARAALEKPTIFDPVFFGKPDVSIDLIDRAMIKSEPLPRDAVLYRAMAERKSFVKSLQVGAEIEELGYASTTRHKDFAEFWPSTDYVRTEKVVLVINAGGSQAVPLYHMDEIAISREGEVLLPRGAKFIVSKVESASVTRAGKIKRFTRVYVNIK